MAGKPDPYADIDFEEITDATGLAVDEIKCLKVTCCSCIFLHSVKVTWPPGVLRPV